MESPRQMLPDLPGLSEHDELMRREAARRSVLVCWSSLCCFKM
jgi:hypothetical protein